MLSILGKKNMRLTFLNVLEFLNYTTIVVVNEYSLHLHNFEVFLGHQEYCEKGIWDVIDLQGVFILPR
jgi:hypothetical protein